MRRIYIGVAALALALSAVAEVRMDMRTVAAIDRLADREAGLSRATRARQSAPSDSVSLIFTVDNDAAVAELERVGVVRGHQGDMYIVTMPREALASVADMEGLRRVSVSRRLKTRLDYARPASNVDAMHAGTSLPQAYDGTGVVVGLMDSGIYPSHVAFMGKDGKTSRVKAVYVYDSNASVTSYTNPGTISKFTTDDSDETHGTHVAGIMAGSYSGNGYHGVATGADIVMTASNLDNASMLLGIEKIIDYAERNGKPAVVNLSVGDNVGPHDGTDDFSTYLARLGERAVICMAAGNEGDLKIALNKEFTSSDKSVSTLIVPQAYYSDYDNFIDGSIEIWGDDSRPVSVSVGLYSGGGSLLATLHTCAVSSHGNLTTISSRRSASGYNATFARYFEGTIKVGSEVDDNNGRYNAYVEYDCEGIGLNSDMEDPSAYIGITISGVAGQCVHAYCDGYYTELSSEGKRGFADGGYDGTVNGSGCGDNIILVGAYSTRNTVPLNDGSTDTYGETTVGDIAYYSSWGTLVDGRQLPHVVAPGDVLVSSISTPYYNRHGYSVARGGKVTANGKTSYWGAMGGTSMATPYMSGVVALWLQADPKLNVDDVLSVINSTSMKDNYYNSDANKVRWGAGKLDAYAGLKEVLRNSAIDGVTSDGTQQMIVTPVGDRRWEVFVAGETALSVSACDINGITIASGESVSGDTSILDLSGAAAGVYIVSAQGLHGNCSSRIIVR